MNKRSPVAIGRKIFPGDFQCLGISIEPQKAAVWLGRGDGTLADLDELRAEAARAHNKRTASYLLGMPLLSDYLEEALSQFGISIEA